jgi:hypothetical protein
VPAVEYLPEVGKAASCAAAVYHSPHPLRFVWHHILPEACGGLTQPGNLVSLCDSCHYSVHILLWQLANGGLAVPRPNWVQLRLARQGLVLAEDAGTAGKIPKEA